MVTLQSSGSLCGPGDPGGHVISWTKPMEAALSVSSDAKRSRARQWCCLTLALKAFNCEIQRSFYFAITVAICWSFCTYECKNSALRRYYDGSV